jgi:hypothetical protein
MQNAILLSVKADGSYNYRLALKVNIRPYKVNKCLLVITYGAGYLAVSWWKQEIHEEYWQTEKEMERRNTACEDGRWMERV